MSSGCGWFIFWRIAGLVGFRCGLVVAGCLCLCCLICLWVSGIRVPNVGC